MRLRLGVLGWLTPGLLLAFAAAAAVACESSSLFTATGQPPGAGGAGSTTTSTSHTGTTTTSTGSTTGSGGDTTTTTSGTGQGGAGAAPSVTYIDCGGSTCTVPPQSCCFDYYQAYGAPQAECVQGAVGQNGCNTSEQGGTGTETRMECQRPSDCPPSELCCGTRGTFTQDLQTYTYYITLTCEPSCEYPAIQMCDPSAIPPTACPIVQSEYGTQQTICKASTLLPTGYNVCGLPG